MFSCSGCPTDAHYYVISAHHAWLPCDGRPTQQIRIPYAEDAAHWCGVADTYRKSHQAHETPNAVTFSSISTSDAPRNVRQLRQRFFSLNVFYGYLGIELRWLSGPFAHETVSLSVSILPECLIFMTRYQFHRLFTVKPFRYLVFIMTRNS